MNCCLCYEILSQRSALRKPVSCGFMGNEALDKERRKAWSEAHQAIGKIDPIFAPAEPPEDVDSLF